MVCGFFSSVVVFSTFFFCFLLFLHVVHLTIYDFTFSVCLLSLNVQGTTKYLLVSK